MSEAADSTRQDHQPTHAEIAERDFFTCVRDALEAWREAGKPHKR